MNEFLDIALPYRRKRTFGASSFALIFVTIVLEVEALALVALGIIGHRFDLFVDLQPVIFPSACGIALAAAAVALVSLGAVLGATFAHQPSREQVTQSENPAPTAPALEKFYVPAQHANQATRVEEQPDAF